MRSRVERLRVYLLASAIVLLLVIGAFIGVARYLRRHSMMMLPLKLALNVLRETANPNFCQSDGKQTKFCIHAAKSVEYNNGKITLHDASMTLFGAKGDRADRIYGDEFEYDKNAEVVRAEGIVHIDLQAAAPTAVAGQGAPAAKVIHVTTSNLVYLQKLGIASTTEPIEFDSAGLTGHAVGADYSTDTALVSLHSAVSMSGVEAGHAVAMTAATAQFDQHSQQALLTRATYASQGRTAAAEQATLYRRPDGTLERIDSKGNVTLTAQGATVVAGHADVALTATSQPQTAVLTGGVKYGRDLPTRQMTGAADSAAIQFDAEVQPQPSHATFTGSVHITERLRATTAANEPWSTRELKAASVEVSLARVDGGDAEVRDVVATGNPHVVEVNRGSLASNKGAGTTEMSANTLRAHLIDTGGAKSSPQIDTVTGRGSTLLHQVMADGKEDTVAADSLDAKLRPKPAAGAAKGAAGTQDSLAQSLLSSVQEGHVQMMQRLPAKPGAQGKDHASGGEQVQHALADRAVYNGDADLMTLSGGVQWSDPDDVLWANQVVVDHKTGNTHATGEVRVSYSSDEPAGSSRATAEAAHIVADSADLDHAAGAATFYGKPVRLWQGGNQILAPVIEISNAPRKLLARTDGAAGATVRTVLAAASEVAKPGAAGAGSAECAASAPAKGDAIGSTPAVSAIQVTSGGLTYVASTGEADFTGGFRAETADGTIRASDGVVYLRQTKAAQNETTGTSTRSNPMASLSGDLDHVVATGRVELDKTGLKATGERLVYTASDRLAVLTGDAKNPPKATDAQGTTTGQELRLHSSCEGKGSDSVEVVGAPGQRAHTDARVSEQGSKEKGKR